MAKKRSPAAGTAGAGNRDHAPQQVNPDYRLYQRKRKVPLTDREISQRAEIATYLIMTLRAYPSQDERELILWILRYFGIDEREAYRLAHGGRLRWGR